MKKVFYRAGETLVETMFSLAIISVTFVFLTGAVVAATRVNSKIRNSGSEFETGNDSGKKVSVTVNVKDVGNIIDSKEATLYQSKNEYYYYRMD